MMSVYSGSAAAVAISLPARDTLPASERLPASVQVFTANSVTMQIPTTFSRITM